MIQISIARRIPAGDIFFMGKNMSRPYKGRDIVQYFISYRLAFSCSTRSVRSQGRSISVRPK